MTVHIVVYDMGYEGQTNEAMFVSRKGAEHYIAEQLRTRPKLNHWRIEEWEVGD